MPTYGEVMARENQLIQIREVVPGTLVPGGTKVLRSDMQPGSEPLQPAERWVKRAIQGFNAAGDAAKTFEGFALSFPLNPRYGLMAYIFDELCGTAYSDTSGGGKRTRKWRLPEAGRVGRHTESMFYGQPEAAMQLLYTFITAFSIASSRSGDTSGDVAYYANKPTPKQPWPGGTNEVQSLAITGVPTGGDFTLSGIDPDTGYAFETDDIVFNATAAQVKTALEAVVGVGNVDTSGGALPGTPVVITWKGDWASENVVQLTFTSGLTGGTSPAGAVTTTTPGVTTALVAPLDTPTIEANHWRVYRADDHTDLATIDMDDEDDPHLLPTVEEHNFAIADAAAAYETEDGTLNARSHVDGATTTTASITLAADEDANSILETGDGCVAEKLYLSFRAMCGTDQMWIDLYCARSDNYGFDNNNNVRRNSIPLERMTNVAAYIASHGSCVFTLVEAA